MRDYLLDIVKNTFDLGCITAVKITGDQQSTTLDAVADDRTVVLSARFHAPVPEFQGLFGMPNLDKLKILLNLQEYRENAQITVNRQDRTGNGTLDAVGLHFTNPAGDFQNDYRFMTSDVVAEKLKTAKPKKTPTWLIEFEPTVASIQRLKMQTQANSDEPLFRVRTEKDLLKFSFGDHSTHAGEFVFHAGITGRLQHSWSWPARQVISILDLAGDKIMRISDEGIAEITVDSGMAVYRYALPAQTK
jgi:hypothetical protein